MTFILILIVVVLLEHDYYYFNAYDLYGSESDIKINDRISYRLNVA